MIYDITPVSKPRQTQSDKWKVRACVARYRAFADECRLKRVHVPVEGGNIVFILPMPKSWSAKKREEMNGEAHTQKPDIDNLLKSLMDAVFPDDSHVWDVRITKLWGDKGAIEIL
jgi:Holliday junction resolvase RusA-like endonuclease